MKSTGIVLLCLTGVLFLACPETPEDEVNPYRQEQIPWPSLADSPWPMFRHDPQGTGRSAFIGPQTGTIAWTIELTGVLNIQSFTSWVIGMNSDVYFGSSNEPGSYAIGRWLLYAVRPDSTIHWTFGEDSTSDIVPYHEIYNAPLVTSGGTIIFGTPGNYMQGGYIYALNPDGTLKWRKAIEYPVRSSNLNIGRDGNLYFSDRNGNLMALDSSGNLHWQLSADATFRADWEIGVALSTDGDVIYVGGADGYSTLYAVSTSGTILWSLDLGAEIDANPIVDNENNIYVGPTSYSADTLGGLYSIAPQGTVRWKHGTKGVEFFEPTIDPDGNIIYAVTTALTQSTLISVDYNGNTNWETPLPRLLTSSVICDAEGTIYLAAGDFLAVSSTGAILWTIPLEESVYHCPVINSDGTLFFGTIGNPKLLFAIN